MDMLGIALAELADIAERRIAKLIDPTMNGGLPIFLIPKEKGGLHNGLMIPQYVAASLVSENKVLAHPASVDSIPTSVNQEDHVSMGTIAARKAWEIILNTENVLAIEYLNATQAIDMRDPKKLGEGTKKAYRAIRKKTSFIKSDRILAKDIEKVIAKIQKEMFPGWYSFFWRKNLLYIVFNSKFFKLNLPSGWSSAEYKTARQFGRSQEIPETYLDFKKYFQPYLKMGKK